MFDRFDHRARKSMVLARREAQRLGHDFIGTEHLLLGLVSEDVGEVALILRELGIELSALRDVVEERVPRGSSGGNGQLPFTPRAKAVLEFALTEAQGLSHDFIADGHLLLGLLRDEDGIAGGVLRSQGVTLDAARVHVRESLAGKPGPRTRSLPPSFSVEVLHRDGTVLARRRSPVPYMACERGDLLRLEGRSSPAFRVLEIEHICEPGEWPPQTWRLVVEPVEEDRAQPQSSATEP